jgi:uncharacterized protein (TIGR02687 family)
MSKISQTLQALFDDHRIIFWYDKNGDSKSEFESMEIDGIEKQELDNNEFGIKYKVLKEMPEAKFLIYSKCEQPKDIDNWLIDLQMLGYMFSADRSSMITSDLGLGLEHKAFIEQHKDKFFNSEKRQSAFSKIIEPQDDIRMLEIKMMSIAINADPTIHGLLFRVFESEKYFETLQKMDLDSLFWGLMKEHFDYLANTPTLQDFVYKLLQNHFYRMIEPTRAVLNKEAYLFVKSWMDSKKYSESYRLIANATEQALNLAHEVHDIDVERLIFTDTYEVCERVVVAYLRDGIVNQTMYAQKVHEIIEGREHTFWYGSYKNIYHALMFASDLLDAITKGNFVMNSFDEGVDKYVNQWQQIDYFYRKFITHLNRAEHVQVLMPLVNKIEDTYLNGYLRVVGDRFSGFITQYPQHQKPKQRHFFKNYIQPVIDKDENIVVIISDAMRYECGLELSNILSSINRYSTECVPMVCSLPSYTQLGMASLLPHQELEIRDQNDQVFVDGKNSAGVAARKKILQDIHPKATAITDEDFLAFNRDDGRAFVKEYNVIYIYHDEIDSTGDKLSSEERVFEAVESSFDTITRIIKQAAGFNRTNVLITSDHGFLYQNRPTEESEFCQYSDIEKPMKMNRRFVIGKDISVNTCTQKFSSDELDIKGENQFLFTTSINKIRVQGGGNRFVHGSASLQELVIPLISSSKKRIDDVRMVDVDVLPMPRITTNSINVSFLQTEPISEKVQPIVLKCGFYTLTGELISSTHTVTFDSSEQDSRNREKRLKFEFKQNANEFNNQTIVMMMKKILSNSTEEPLFKEAQTQLKLSFFNDFDDL